MVRISNFIYYCTGASLVLVITDYLYNLLKEDNKEREGIIFFNLNHLFADLAIILTIFNIFFNFFYSFDASNYYSREKYFYLFVVLLYLSFLCLFVFVYKNRNNMTKFKYRELVIYCLLPCISLYFQGKYYGTFVNNIALTLNILIFTVSSAIEKERIINEKEKELTDAKTESMLAQIQPHFIFNSLTAIQSLILKSPQEAYNSISDFSDFLRGVTNSLSADKTIDVAEDLKTAVGYIKTEQIRFGDSLKVEINVEDSDYRIPPLTIQPIIENAIRHGIRKKEGGGTVKLNLKKEGDYHLIEIVDDGVGFDPNNVDSQRHVGIENVRQRVKLISNAEMEINSVIGEGTTIRILFPNQE